MRQRLLKIWDYNDPRRQCLINLRPSSANEVVFWAHAHEKEKTSPLAEIAANGALVLLTVTWRLLDRQIQFLAATFEKEGGFTERLYQFRKSSRKIAVDRYGKLFISYDLAS